MNKKSLIGFLGFISLSSMSLSTSAQPQQSVENEGWNYSLGVGSMMKPKYKGSAEYDFWPIPYFDIKYSDLFYLTPAKGAGFNFETNSNFDFGLGLGFDFGRDEEDGDKLAGMGEVDFGLLARLSLGYEVAGLTFGLEYDQDVTDVHGGFEIETSIAKRFMIREWRSILNLQAFATYGSSDYLNTYYGVDSQQSLRTGYDVLSLESGIHEVGLSGTLIRPINKNWSFWGILRFSRMIGDSADSPVIESNNQFFGGLFFVRKM